MEVSFEDYYGLVKLELEKSGKRDKNYFDTLDLLINSTIYGDGNSKFDEIEKIEILKRIVYVNGSLSIKKLKKIDKELGYEKYYEESCK